MKKTLIPVVLAMVILAVSVTAAPALASEADDWAYPENVLAFMFRLGIACEAAGIEIPYDPYTIVDGDSGYFTMSVGELSVSAMYDMETLQLTALTFPMDSENYEPQQLILAALCEEAAITTSGTMTKDLFLKLGDIVYTQALAGMTDTGAAFPIGAYTFTVTMGDGDQLNMMIRAN